MRSGYDFAIFGTGSLAALLAGILAHDHGKQVILVADPVSSQRLARNIDLALPFATRPASWRMLRTAEAEIAALLKWIDGADALTPTDVQIVADLPETTAALSHMRHVAAGYGVVVRHGLFRGVSQLTSPISLTDSKVQTVGADQVKLTFARSGAAELAVADEPLSTSQIVLADDTAILALLPERDRPALLVTEQMTATLTEPAKRLAAPIVRYADRGVTLAQRPDRSVLALVSGEQDVEARLASCLPGPFPLQRRATAHYRRLVIADGAPFIGRVKPSKVFICAGLGDAAAFFAAPLARFLAGVPAGDEKAWFSAHDPARQNRDAVADFVEARG